MMTTNLFVIVKVKQLRTGRSFRILLPFFPNILGCWRPKFSNFIIGMLEWNTKHFPLNLQSGSTLSNFRDVGVGLNSETRYATARQFVLKETFI